MRLRLSQHGTLSHYPRSTPSRALSEDKTAMILNALVEKTPLIGLCRTFKVSPDTVYALLKKK